jgi:hypothetical protein
LRKAEATMTGIIMRTCAQNTVLALPSMKFMARSRPELSSSSSRVQWVSRQEHAVWC